MLHTHLLPLLAGVFVSVSWSARVFAVTTETVVGLSGRRVALPCRTEAARQLGVEVCWGRGQPSLFTCHNTLINVAGSMVIFRRSPRFMVSVESGGMSSLSIFNPRLSDSGFYHCRVQLPGLFNDQTFTVHLIIINSRPVTHSSSAADNLKSPQWTTTGYSRDAATVQTEGNVTVDSTSGPRVEHAQSPVEHVSSLQTFVGHTVRLSLIIFIPAVLLTAAHRVWRTKRAAGCDHVLNESESRV